jgi:hypothetical protein
MLELKAWHFTVNDINNDNGASQVISVTGRIMKWHGNSFKITI